MSEEIDRQSIVDEEHLKLLSLGYMISAGFAAFFALFGLVYVVMGIIVGYAIAHGPPGKNGEPPPAFIGLIFAAAGFAIFIIAMSVAFARYWAARCVKQRKSRTFCMVIAAISCLEFPYGTALGVLSFMVLGRPSVVKLFEPPPAELKAPPA